MLMFGMRLGADPRTVVTTTPRPTKLIRDLVRDPICMVTRGSTYENRANLAPGFFDQIIRKYEGTRLGRQELEAELLEDTPGALWSHAIIDTSRQAAAPQLARIVVAIDPAVTSGEDADETGIIVVGKDHQGHGYVLADASGRHQPVEWAKIAVAAYRAHHADRIVAERNNGGALQFVRLPDALHGTQRDANRFGHCPAGPVSGFVRRLGAGHRDHARRDFRRDRGLAGLAGLVA